MYKEISHKQMNSRFFRFPGIYSDKNTIFEDDIHGHKSVDYQNGVPKISVKYYYQSKNHPIVFVNTSNHTLAKGDNNHDFWKWEYIPWVKEVPIKKIFFERILTNLIK